MYSMPTITGRGRNGGENAMRRNSATPNEKQRTAHKWWGGVTSVRTSGDSALFGKRFVPLAVYFNIMHSADPFVRYLKKGE